MNWMLKTTGYVQAELRLGYLLRRSFDEARNRQTVRLWHRKLAHRSFARYLLACNSYGRLLWAGAYCAELSECFDLDEDDRLLDESVHLLTITDTACCTTDESQEIPIRRFRERLRPRAAGLNYIGMIEPAYYVNVCKGARYKGRRVVSWHAHYIVWGIGSVRLATLVAGWNEKEVYRSVADGIPAAHCVVIRPADLPHTVCYTLKSPTHGYRLRKIERITEDGEIVFGFKQRKQTLRKGERIRLFHLMKNLYLDQMALAGGQGVAMLRRVKKAALGPHSRF